ncbi:MAG: YybS family protein [Thermodesulfobacteriota bacterium]|nr:YybS family protein [Thermodesulfobacteriota bacterium]
MPAEQNRLFREVTTGILVTVLLFTGIVSIPLLGFFLSILLPMPVLVYRLKLGRKMGAVITSVVFCIILAVAGGIYVDLLFYAALLLVGFFLGEYLEKPLSIEKTGVYTCLTTVGICILGMLIVSAGAGQNLVSIVSENISTNIDITLKLYSEMGVPQENIDVMINASDTIKYVIVRILPALITALLMFEIWLNLLFIKKFLAKKGITLARLEGLNQWRAPEYLVWAAIFFGIFIGLPVQALKLFGINLLIILMPVYFFQGIAVVSYFIEKKRFPVFLKVLIYSIIAIQQIFLLLVMGLGFFDTWINFRKLDTMESSDK